MSEDVLGDVERGIADEDEVAALRRALGQHATRLHLNLDEPPRAHEICALLRRRRDIHRRTLARTLGVSPWRVTQMERGRWPADVLVAYWQQATGDR